MSRIPLLPAALEILRRYEHDEACLARSRVLPTPSNQKMNAYMKEIAAVCGIDKVLTTHCARHTFACMAVEYGMPIDVLAKILGHSNTNMTRHYAKFSETSPFYHNEPADEGTGERRSGRRTVENKDRT